MSSEEAGEMEAPAPELTSEGFYKKWKSNIDDALKREKKYRESARRVVDLYEAKTPESTPFSILYSNTETLVPAIYNSRPIPVVMRRFKDADALGKAVSDVSTRVLKYLIDIDSADYDAFDETTAAAALDGVVTNRGLQRFRFEGDEIHQCVYAESVRWDKFCHGYARTWKKVPWIAFEHDFSEEELRKNFPETPFELKSTGDTGLDNGNSSGKESQEELTGVKTYKVFEIWDKVSRRQFFISNTYPKGVLRINSDPLGLTGFFPVPKPLNFMRKITTLVPTPLYEHYKSQANELNDVTRRLKNIVRAIRYRGVYNATIEEMAQVLKADENDLIPSQNMQALGDNSNVRDWIWTVPVEELARTAQQLYQHRESVKQTIYEITGISDILRGASVASETATAQNIKNQWGTLRLKKMQKEVQRFCRESLQIVLEIAAARFGPQTLKQMTGLPYMFAEQKAQVQQQLQMQQMQAQMTGQQMPPPPPELQLALSLPSWEDILGVLQDSLVRSYKIDIETNSTIDAEASKDKQDIAELMNAISQFLNGVAPMVQEGILPFELAKAMLLMISRRYEFGSNVEEILEGMQSPQPQQQGPDPAEQAKQEAEAAKAQATIKQLEMEGQLAAQEHQFKMDEMKLSAAIKQQELEIKQQELLIQQKAVGMKAQQQEMQHRQKMQQLQMKEETDAG